MNNEIIKKDDDDIFLKYLCFSVGFFKALSEGKREPIKDYYYEEEDYKYFKALSEGKREPIKDYFYEEEEYKYFKIIRDTMLKAQYETINNPKSKYYNALYFSENKKSCTKKKATRRYCNFAVGRTEKNEIIINFQEEKKIDGEWKKIKDLHLPDGLKFINNLGRIIDNA